jgi:hypothetical protein
MQVPWFLVQIMHPGDDRDVEHEPKKSFIVPEERVLDLVRLQNVPRLWIESISIISPGYMNGSAGWQMNPLAAIWTASEPDEPSHEATLYELDDGRRYVQSAFGTALKSLVQPVLVADFRPRRAAA